MRALLSAEVKAGQHSPGKAPALRDQSGAMGLLWVRRGLQLWFNFFVLREELRGAMAKRGEDAADPDETAGASLFRAFQASHGNIVGWVSKRMAGGVARAMPSWLTLTDALGIDAAEGEEVRAWVDAVQPVLERMSRVQEEAGLEDRRRSC